MTKPRFWEIGVFTAFGLFLIAFPKKFYSLLRRFRLFFIRFKQDK